MRKSQQTQREKGRVRRKPRRGSISLGRLYGIGVFIDRRPRNGSTDS